MLEIIFVIFFVPPYGEGRHHDTIKPDLPLNRQFLAYHGQSLFYNLVIRISEGVLILLDPTNLLLTGYSLPRHECQRSLRWYLCSLVLYLGCIAVSSAHTSNYFPLSYISRKGFNFAGTRALYSGVCDALLCPGFSWYRTDGWVLFVHSP